MCDHGCAIFGYPSTEKAYRSNRLEMCRWVGINTKLDDATMPPSLVPMFKKLIDFDFSEYFV